MILEFLFLFTETVFIYELFSSKRFYLVLKNLKVLEFQILRHIIYQINARRKLSDLKKLLTAKLKALFGNIDRNWFYKGYLIA